MGILVLRWGILNVRLFYIKLSVQHNNAPEDDVTQGYLQNLLIEFSNSKIDRVGNNSTSK